MRRMRWLLAPRHRLLTALVTAALFFLPSSSWLSTGPRIVLAWNTGVTVLLGLIAIMMWGTPPHETLSRARHEETSSVVILLVTVLAVAGGPGGDRLWSAGDHWHVSGPAQFRDLRIRYRGLSRVAVAPRDVLIALCETVLDR